MNNREAFEAWFKEKFPSSTFERWMSISEPYMDKEVNARFEGYQAALASQVQQTKSKPVPLEAIGGILAQVMELACANGANSISMPDDYVAVAHFLCHPNEYSLPPAPDGVDK